MLAEGRGCGVLDVVALREPGLEIDGDAITIGIPENFRKITTEFKKDPSRTA